MLKSVTKLEAVTLLFLVSVVLFVAVPGWGALTERLQATERTEACRENLKEICDAIRRYTLAKRGGFPHHLDDLVPRWIPALPQCTAGPSPEDYGYEVKADVAYTVFCRGDRHGDAGLKLNQPFISR